MIAVDVSNNTAVGKSNDTISAPTIANIVPIVFRCAFILLFITFLYDYILIALPKHFQALVYHR